MPAGRFPPERFVALRSSVEQGLGNLMFACHKSPEGKAFACVGYLLSPESENNFFVRIALSTGRLDRDRLVAKGPLYASYDAMARANGVDLERDD